MTEAIVCASGPSCVYSWPGAILATTAAMLDEIAEERSNCEQPSETDSDCGIDCKKTVVGIGERRTRLLLDGAFVRCTHVPFFLKKITDFNKCPNIIKLHCLE